MKYIYLEGNQVIKVRGRRFYYPPKDKWIEDKYLPLWSGAKLLRLGIYEFIEVPYDKSYYKKSYSTEIA